METQPRLLLDRLSGDATGAANRGFRAPREGLHSLGYREGENVAVECRFAEGKYERLDALAAELVRLDPAVLVAAAALRRSPPNVQHRAFRSSRCTRPIQSGLTMHQPLTFDNRERIVNLVARLRMLAMYGSREAGEFLQAWVDTFRRAA